MCGIVGLIQEKSIIDPLLKALERLEYRGYDSAGLAIFEEKDLLRYRSVGSLAVLKQMLPPLLGTVGIGHTRWATHGAPHESNAHPHCSGPIALVHNGIVENFAFLKKKLLMEGFEFESETDTEVIAHLLHFHYCQDYDPLRAFSTVLSQLDGNFALACLIQGHENKIFIARKGSTPLIIGYGKQGHVVSSDALGCIGLADQISSLESETWAVLTLNEVKSYDFQGKSFVLSRQLNPCLAFAIDRGSFNHYMLKEIHEQASVVQRLLPQSFPSLRTMAGTASPSITLLGCGTSFYAGWVSKYYLEKDYSVTLELASEFHYRKPTMLPGLTLALSQSGETADTLKAAAYAKSQHQVLASIVNTNHSSLARVSDWVLEMQAGPEVGVASTKSFVAQLWVLMQLAGLPTEQALDLPGLMEQTLLLMPDIQGLARSFMHTSNLLYLGRGPSYPLALEGALKMKELSYIHAEGMAAGELKHGPIALIDKSFPVILLAPYDGVFEKTLSTLHEISARDGNVVVLTDEQGACHMGLSAVREVLILPFTPYEKLHPFLYVLVLQLLAYYTALYRGCPIDKPRNLAKSVTVE